MEAKEHADTSLRCDWNKTFNSSNHYQKHHCQSLRWAIYRPFYVTKGTIRHYMKTPSVKPYRCTQIILYYPIPVMTFSLKFRLKVTSLLKRCVDLALVQIAVNWDNTPFQWGITWFASLLWLLEQVDTQCSFYCLANYISVIKEINGDWPGRWANEIKSV